MGAGSTLANCGRGTAAALLVGIILLAAYGCGGNRHTFREPIAVDFDMADIPEPAPDRTSQYYDFLDRTLTKQILQGFDMPRNVRKIAGKPKQAENVDAFDNVANSSWYTNRNGMHRMAIADIERGPDKGSGPADGVWTVVRAKTHGITPGFNIRDARGDVYVIKFDPPANPEMSTAAEMVSTKLFYAMGYNTPENYLVHFDADRLAIDPAAKISGATGKKRPMTREDLDRILSRVYRRSDGHFRAVASKFLDGKPLGPYHYIGTRKDDPNDVIPHEHRRELRGLRLAAAWLNHNDVRRINSLDMYVEENGRRFIRHYLIDFGATLGSASLFASLPSEGHEYQFDHWEAQKSLYTLGVYKRSWRDAKPVQYPTVGYFESEIFNPAKWKPNYPNPAFENMTIRDAYWATKIIMSFTNDQIRAAVEMGGYSNPEAAEYLTRTLIERRDKIARHWYGKVNALDGFALDGDGASQVLTFSDLEVEAAFADYRETAYRYTVSHNACEAVTEIESETVASVAATGDRPEVPLNGLLREAATRAATGEDCDRYFCVTFRSTRPHRDNGDDRVTVHLYYRDPSTGFEIVGVEHEE